MSNTNFPVMMATEVYGLTPVTVNLLTSRTGARYSFLFATVAASSEADARQFVMKQDTLGLPWGDPAAFECKPIATIGQLPPEERAIIHWWPA